MPFRKKSIRDIAKLICGDGPSDAVFVYRSSYYLTEFFEDIDLNFTHDGSTRAHWVADRLEELLKLPQSAPNVLPEPFTRVIRHLMDQRDMVNEDDRQRPKAMAELNAILLPEGFEAFYGEDDQCYLRHVKTNTVATPSASPHRPLTAAEKERRSQLTAYLDKASEDELIEEVLLPLFRQMGFHRVTVAGHKDKSLEYGKDVWMKYTLPTTHVLYFGLQAKKGKLDASGITRNGNVNVSEIHNQALMMLGHEIFDPEISKRILVDHAFIVAGGEITKQARNWLGHNLDASQRRSIIFMDRADLLDLFVVNNIPLPAGAVPVSQAPWDEEPPF